MQPEAESVQKVVENALSTVLGESIRVTGAGRTDAGVHALRFCAHFDSLSGNLAQNTGLVFRLNRFLPGEISVAAIREVVPDANARFSAISRTYRYFISREKYPFFCHTSWYLYGRLNIDAMNQACGILLRHKDFTSFSRLHSGNMTNTCNIYLAGWEESGNTLIFTIKADRFLRNMVRAIVGTMTDVGFGKLDPEGFENIILAKDRGRAGISAPARGLFLADIEYPDEIFV